MKICLLQRRLLLAALVHVFLLPFCIVNCSAESVQPTEALVGELDGDAVNVNPQVSHVTGQFCFTTTLLHNLALFSACLQVFVLPLFTSNGFLLSSQNPSEGQLSHETGQRSFSSGNLHCLEFFLAFQQDFCFPFIITFPGLSLHLSMVGFSEGDSDRNGEGAMDGDTVGIPESIANGSAESEPDGEKVGVRRW